MILSSFDTSVTASPTALLTTPIRKLTLCSLMYRLATFTAYVVLDLSSVKIRSIIRPFTPPFALISSIAISAAATESIPYRPPRPVIGYIPPMTIFSAATATSASPRTSARPIATIPCHFILLLSIFLHLLGFANLFPVFPQADHLLRLARLLRQVRLSQHHDPLRLRGTGPVQRLHQRGHRRHPLDVPAQLPLVLRREPLLPGEIFLQQPAHLAAVEIRVGRQGRQEPPRDVVRQPPHLVHEPGHVLLDRVRQERIHQPVPRRELLRQRGGTDRPREIRLDEVDDLGELVADDAVLDRPVDLGQQGGRAEENVGVPPLAPAVVRPVPRREPVHERPRELPFPGHEDPLVRDEDVLEDQRALAADHPPVRPAVERPDLFFPLVVALPAEDQGQPRRVDGHRAGDRVVGPLRRQSQRRHHEDLVGVRRAR